MSMEFHVLNTEAANARRKEFVRHLNDASPAVLRRAHGAAAAPDRCPRVTILVPTADGQRYGYLDQLLDQLGRQSCQSFEVLLIQGDTRQGRAINLGAAAAEGEFLLTFDDDTRLGNPELIECLIQALDADPSIGMAGVENRVPPNASWLVRRLMLEVPRRCSPPVPEVTDSDMAEHPCLMMRKSLFYRVGGEHEVIPRGLDPYLRREFRSAGARVVVVPGAWIHHLPPPTLGKALRQFYRNGKMSALVSRQFPDLALDNALEHGEAAIRAQPRWLRAGRHLGRMVAAAVLLRWIYLATSLAYGLGVVAGSLPGTAAEGARGGRR